MHFKTINDLIKVIQKNLTPDLLNKEWSKRVKKYHLPFKGHCYVASEALYHMLPDKENYMPCVLSINTNTHWYLSNKLTGKILDPTVEQFKSTPPYYRGKGTGFLTKQPSKRCQILLNRIKDGL